MNIVLEPSQLRAMKRISKDYGYTIPELIKSLVDGFLERQIEMHDELDDLCIRGFNRMGGNHV